MFNLLSVYVMLMVPILRTTQRDGVFVVVVMKIMLSIKNLTQLVYVYFT